MNLQEVVVVGELPMLCRGVIDGFRLPVSLWKALGFHVLFPRGSKYPNVMVKDPSRHGGVVFGS